MKEGVDANAIVKHEDRSPAAQTFQSLTNIDWAQIDADKAKILVEMQERMIKRQAEEEFNQAFTEMQPELPVIEKDGSIIVKGKLRSKYSTFEAIMEAIAEPLRKHGFAINFNTEETPDMATAKITCKLRHKAGHSEPYQVRLPIERTDFRSAMQDVATTISFGKRWLLKLSLNIVEKGEGVETPKQLAFVSEEQLKELRYMIEEGKADLNRLLAYFDIQKLEDLNVKDYKEAASMLAEKVARRRAEAAQAEAEKQ